jgi:hypothetical protein
MPLLTLPLQLTQPLQQLTLPLQQLTLPLQPKDQHHPVYPNQP